MSNSAAACWSEPRASMASSNFARPSPNFRRLPKTIHTRSLGSTVRHCTSWNGDNRSMGPTMPLSVRRRLAAVARGERAADLALRGAVVLNVFTGEVLPAHVAIVGERIAYVGTRDDMIGPRTRIIDVTDRVLVPGYI